MKGYLFSPHDQHSLACISSITTLTRLSLFPNCPNFISSFFFYLKNRAIYNSLSMAHWFSCPSLFISRPLFPLFSFYFFLFQHWKTVLTHSVLCFSFPQRCQPSPLKQPVPLSSKSTHHSDLGFFLDPRLLMISLGLDEWISLIFMVSITIHMLLNRKTMSSSQHFSSEMNIHSWGSVFAL